MPSLSVLPDYRSTDRSYQLLHSLHPERYKNNKLSVKSSFDRKTLMPFRLYNCQLNQYKNTRVQLHKIHMKYIGLIMVIDKGTHIILKWGEYNVLELIERISYGDHHGGILWGVKGKNILGNNGENIRRTRILRGEYHGENIMGRISWGEYEATGTTRPLVPDSPLPLRIVCGLADTITHLPARPIPLPLIPIQGSLSGHVRA